MALLTLPLPLLCLANETVTSATKTLNRALTLRAWSILTVQLPVPVHAPLQPAKTDPAEGVADRVTLELTANLAEQLLPQEIKGWSKLMPVCDASQLR
jgi:hypothetical protein